MVVVMDTGASEAQIENVIATLSGHGFDVHRSTGANRTILGAIGVRREFDHRRIEMLGGVAEVHRITEPYKFASRTWKQDDTTFALGEARVGGPDVIVFAGPGVVESEEQIEGVAAHVAQHRGAVLRGGAGHGLDDAGLRLLRTAADRHGLLVSLDVATPGRLGLLDGYADVFEVAARNMENRELLSALARAGKPVLLRRGAAATIEEWLLAADMLLSGGNARVVLCESGIRTFEPYTRLTLDVSAIPVVQKKSHLPVFVDPGGAVGRRNHVLPLARAAVAAGAAGLVLALHPDPPSARVEGPQSLSFDQFADLMRQVSRIADAL